jgi:hypothetical protein
MFDPQVQVVVYEGAGPLQWIEPAARRSSWSRELERRTFDPTWKAPPESAGSLPFDPQEWRAGDHHLLLFDDHD